MGLGKWLARVGNVGGTARWAANGYHFFRSREPDAVRTSDADIFRLMIVSRYELLPNDNAKQSLLAIADELIGLRGLVVAILSVEAGFSENSQSNQLMFMDVIEEELQKKGIPQKIVRGRRTWG